MGGANKISRRHFMAGTAAAAAVTVVPRHVLGRGGTAPSETLGGALIGCGGRGWGTWGGLSNGHDVRCLAVCDIDRMRLEGAVARGNNISGGGCKGYVDFREVIERKDIDLVAIATPPHWHPLISIAAMQAGKDVLCEKPMTRFIAEGRAVVEAQNRYKRIYQIGTYGRFGASRNEGCRQVHKIMASGFPLKKPVVHIKAGGLKAKEWSGFVNPEIHHLPTDRIEWDLYCGPAPMRPFNWHRLGGTHRGYWDYEGGGLADMGQHHFDGVQWTYAKDFTSPVRATPFAPPAHQTACNLYGWIELEYEDGTIFVFDSREWGKHYDRKPPFEDVRPALLSEEDQKKLADMPDPEPMIGFAEAVKTRRLPGGHAESSHRSATLLHLANLAVRVGREIRYDPVKERIIGDDEADRLVNPPTRAPWHL